MSRSLYVIALGWFLLSASAGRTAESAATKVGVYDSRAVAFAHFWSAPERTDRDALIASARAAKQAGDTAKQQELTAKIQALQAASHLQVFSTAPATEAMKALAPRLPDLARELGVARFVSKWDEAALAEVPTSARIDVTDRLAAEFKPDAQRLKTMAEMRKVAPLPLQRAQQMLKAGKL
jgi:hypothetical protein